MEGEQNDPVIPAAEMCASRPAPTQGAGVNGRCEWGIDGTRLTCCPSGTGCE